MQHCCTNHITRLVSYPQLFETSLLSKDSRATVGALGSAGRWLLSSASHRSTRTHTAQLRPLMLLLSSMRPLSQQQHSSMRGSSHSSSSRSSQLTRRYLSPRHDKPRPTSYKHGPSSDTSRVLQLNMSCNCVCVQGGPNAGGPDAFMTGLAGNMLRQSGENYFQRGQAFMQSKMGFMSTDSLHYYYNLNAEYGATSASVGGCEMFSAVCSACCARAPMLAEGCVPGTQCARSC